MNRRLTLWIVLGAVLLTGLAAVVTQYADMAAQIRTVAMPTGPRPAPDPDAMNILIMGSDTRAHGNRALGGGKVQTPRSDTTVLLHIPYGHRSAIAVSLPRDAVVARPACGPARSPLNWSFAYGGPTCTVATVERVTGLRVDHFAVLDFASAADLATAVGGVPVTVPAGIPAKDADGLKPGRQLLKGRDAVAYLRLRHVGADQSDLRRIRRQQSFLRAFLKRVKTLGPEAVLTLAKTASAAIVTDPGLDTPAARLRLAMDLRDVDLSRVRFATPPLEPDPGNPAAWVRFAPSAASLWRSLRP
ncbi:LCP family protein [Nonomuraea sp. NPDC050556]|uniref:LCP family protein n=1 Tax=Nonomuraea sp. NPDC050556 TaxID=3364369 RepID=UPI00379BD059